jgi:endonuclease YncB( thermonuclease family)
VRSFITVLTVLAIAIANGSAVAQLSGQANVIDGDDIEICTYGSCKRVRLCGIDAPEQRCPGYQEATAGLRGLVQGKQVRCVQVDNGTVCDGRSKPTNRDRIVAQCFVDDTDIAGALVERGLACDWKRFSGGYYSLGGKGRACPRNHRRDCAAVAPGSPGR